MFNIKAKECDVFVAEGVLMRYGQRQPIPSATLLSLWPAYQAPKKLSYCGI